MISSAGAPYTPVITSPVHFPPGANPPDLDIRDLVVEAKNNLQNRETLLASLKDEEADTSRQFDENLSVLKKEAHLDKWLARGEQVNKCVAMAMPITMGMSAVTGHPFITFGAMALLGAAFAANRVLKKKRATLDLDFNNRYGKSQEYMQDLNRMRNHIAVTDRDVTRLRSLWESLQGRQDKAMDDMEAMARAVASDSKASDIVDDDSFVVIKGIKLDKSNREKLDKLDLVNQLEKLRKK